MDRLILLALIVLWGCAPSADLRVPLAERPVEGGRLAIVRLGDVAPGSETGDDLAAYRATFWDDLRDDLLGRYSFSEVEYVSASDAWALDTLRVLAERAPLGSQRQGWKLYRLRVPRDPTALAPGADVVVVLDAVSVLEGVHGNPVAVGAGVGAFRIAMPLPGGRGITATSDVLVYRRGAVEPVGAGVISVYGQGSGFFGNHIDAASSGRTVTAFADRLALHGRFARR